MDTINPYPLPNDYYLCDGRIRAYSFIPIHPVDRLQHHPDLITQSMRHYYPLTHPYTWCVTGDHAVVVNVNDLLDNETPQPSSPPSSTATNQQSVHQRYDQVHSETLDEVMINESNEEAEGRYELSEITEEDVAMLEEFMMDERLERAVSFVEGSGLTKKLICKKLGLVRYEEEEDEDEEEMCVVCQVEFERNERVGVLQCKHRYHPKCIEEWLLRQNVCPLCKGQGLKV